MYIYAATEIGLSYLTPIVREILHN